MQHIQQAPAPIPGPVAVQKVAADVIDLTEDNPVNTVNVTTTPAPVPKPDPSYWKKHGEYLRKRLIDQSRTDSYRLLQSMKEFKSPEKKHRYCERHWQTEEAALNDIIEKSRWFLDAAELFLYDAKWSRLTDLFNLEDISEDQRKARDELEAQIADEKALLGRELEMKRASKVEQERFAQWSNWASNLSRDGFKKAFNMPKNDANVRLMCSKARWMDEKAKGQAGARKRTTDGPPAEGDASPAKRRKTGGCRTSKEKTVTTSVSPIPDEQPDTTRDAEGETDDEDDLFAAAMEGELQNVWEQRDRQDQPTATSPPHPEAGTRTDHIVVGVDEGYNSLSPYSPNEASETTDGIIGEEENIEEDDDLRSLFEDDGDGDEEC